MSNLKQHLPGVRRIVAVDAMSLPANVRLRAICGQPTPVLAPGIEIAHRDARLEIKRERKAGTWVATVELQFKSDVDYSDLAAPALCVETVDGGKWVIGARERPWPSIETTEAAGESDGTGLLRHVVKWITSHGLAPIPMMPMEL